MLRPVGCHVKDDRRVLLDISENASKRSQIGGQHIQLANFAWSGARLI